MLIPKDKFDVDFAPNREVNFNEIKDSIPELLGWLNDMNWPVSASVAKFISPFIGQIEKDILQVFCTNDDDWKVSVAILLLREHPSDFSQDFKANISELLRYPMEEYVQELLEDFISKG